MSDSEQAHSDEATVQENVETEAKSIEQDQMHSSEKADGKVETIKVDAESNEVKQKTQTGNDSEPKETKQKNTENIESDKVEKEDQQINEEKKDGNTKNTSENKTHIGKKNTKNKKGIESRGKEQNDEKSAEKQKDSNKDGKREGKKQEGKSTGKDVKKENVKKENITKNENEQKKKGEKNDLENKHKKNKTSEKQEDKKDKDNVNEDKENVKKDKKNLKKDKENVKGDKENVREDKEIVKEGENKKLKQRKQTDKEQGSQKKERKKEKAPSPTAQKQKDENNEQTEKKVEKNKQPKEEETDDKQAAERNDGQETKQQKQEQPNKNKELETDRSKTDKKHQEYIKVELQRLEDSLKREASKIQAPTQKPYTPYLFNSLEPYCNTYTTRFLIQMPEEQYHGFTSRTTAQGLIDPWQDLKMDQELPPIIASRPANRHAELKKEEKVIEERKKRKASSEKNGSTRLPRIPIIHLNAKDLAMKDLYYSDVPALRNELKTKYSMNAKSKIQQDYVRTHEDFYRMELDKLDEVHPINRRHMTSTYFAYLQNTPGSKKAITECVRSLEPIKG